MIARFARWLTSFFAPKPTLTVRAHTAFFTADEKQVAYYFLNIRNNSKAPVVIANLGHAAGVVTWSGPAPLPFRLQPGFTVEFWTPVAEAGEGSHDQFVVSLREGQRFVSTLRSVLPGTTGAVPNGRY